MIEETNFARGVYYLTFWIDKKSFFNNETKQNKRQSWNMVLCSKQRFRPSHRTFHLTDKKATKLLPNWFRASVL